MRNSGLYNRRSRTGSAREVFSFQHPSRQNQRRRQEAMLTVKRASCMAPSTTRRYGTKDMKPQPNRPTAAIPNEPIAAVPNEATAIVPNEPTAAIPNEAIAVVPNEPMQLYQTNPLRSASLMKTKPLPARLRRRPLPPGPLHPMPHHRRAVARFTRHPEVFHRPAHLPAPVRIFGRRPRKVLLLALFRHVFLVDQPQHRCRAGKESYDRLVQFAREFGNSFRRAFIIVGQEMKFEQRVQQMLFVARPVVLLPFVILLVDRAGPAAGLNVVKSPETRDRRKVMRRRRSQRLCRIIDGPPETPLVPFEVQQPVTQNPKTRKHFTNAVFHRSQIFADHHRVVAHAFERKNPDQIFRVVANVRAMRGVMSLRNPVKAEQPHHMVNTQRAPMPQRMPDRFRIEPVTVCNMPVAIGRRKRPVLPVRREIIRRRPDAIARYVKIAMR